MQSLKQIIFKCFQLSDPVSATTSNGLRLPFRLMFDVWLSCPPFSQSLNCRWQPRVPTDCLFVFDHACFTYRWRNGGSFSELLIGEGTEWSIAFSYSNRMWSQVKQQSVLALNKLWYMGLFRASKMLASLFKVRGLLMSKPLDGEQLDRNSGATEGIRPSSVVESKHWSRRLRNTFVSTLYLHHLLLFSA